MYFGILLSLKKFQHDVIVGENWLTRPMPLGDRRGCSEHLISLERLHGGINGQPAASRPVAEGSLAEG